MFFPTDHASTQVNLDDVNEQVSMHLLSDDDSGVDDNTPLVRFTPESLDFGHQ